MGPVFEPAEVQQELKWVNYRHVHVDAATRTLTFDTPGVELDLGAFGKGNAVNRTVEMLRATGVMCALLPSGLRSIYSLGAPPDEQGWKITVCDPLYRRQQACSLKLRNLSILISGDYGKSFLLDGRFYVHILDPHTGPSKGYSWRSLLQIRTLRATRCRPPSSWPRRTAAAYFCSTIRTCWRSSIDQAIPPTFLNKLRCSHASLVF
jgi:FAD:protein FMN transferase